VFEAFRQADGTTSRKYGGTGLGLTICKRICTLLGGKITVESQFGGGSTFSIILPVRNTNIDNIPFETNFMEQPLSTATATTPVPAIKYTEEQAAALPETTTNKNNLLIIEDDPNFVTILKDIAKSKGYNVIVAESGEAGLHLADFHKPKAIILDISLPGIDGFEVMKRLKENSETKSIPVHFISATDMTMKAMHMGAVGFLTKPVSSDALNAAFSKIESVNQKSVKKLLIVEDNEIQRESIVELIGNGDVVTTAVESAEEAYRELLQNDFDCMILDLGLKDMDGLQFINRIKNDNNIGDIPIIIYTGQDLTQKEENVLKQYAGSIIIKGAKSPERLLAETSLFLHRVEENFPEAKKKMLELKDKESILTDKKVLIVDDDMRNVFALSRALEGNGMIVEVAQNGQEALDAVKDQDDIDIVLMDIMMPVMDGYESTRLIRQTDNGQKLPIIALTAKAMQDDREKCIKAGANEYMPKPVNIDKLTSLLRVWLYN
jgi:tubulin-specific chaperone A